MTSWSKEPPSVAAVYWWRDLPHCQARPVRIDRHGDAFGEKVERYSAKNMGGEWGSKIPSPDELEALEMCAKTMRDVVESIGDDYAFNRIGEALEALDKARGER